MNIAVNTRLLLQDHLEGIGFFEQEVLRRIVAAHPEHRFFFLFDRPYGSRFVFGPNVTPIVVKPATRHPLLWRLWFDVRVPLVLRRIKADVFVSPESYASLTTRVPQCLVVHDLGFLHQPDAYKGVHLGYLRRMLPRFVRRARVLCTVSDFTRADLQQQYQLPAHRIRIVQNGVRAGFAPLGYEERAVVKERYTGGTEYFLYAGALQPRKNLINLLKGFSQFKKRQKSNWKLVLAGRLAWKNDEFLTLLQSYKYRDDVVLTGYVDDGELQRLMAACYAFVYPSLFEGFGVPVLEAMQSGVPVLTSSNSAMAEVCGPEGALYFDPKEPASIAGELMHIYKDEDGRRQLIEKGLQRAKDFSWEKSAEQLWAAILETAGTPS
ncbi:glycosyltransferase family 4 protein [Flaviaesturariibacter aridisoli]|uniref:Glycosyltransferase family 1 protein n=1 Tax=Flaviaesturariibacter aridisoli TaxID=2545761 RepID=A0A4R4DWH2_9BACT|nr:glycosyltransferase family 1 protein [Flaviaesturariibacter aridisoli]TCZ65771.1 glycosyltransferase family 1 protein [Flaviaesturariibacter aridisoli]